MEEQQNARASALADFIMAAILVVVGLYVFIEAFNMPRLEARRVHPLTIPGLVPMALGAALVGLALLLGIRAYRLTDRGSAAALLAVLRTKAAARAAAAGGLVLAFTLLLIGHMPFWLASMLFIFGFIIVLEVFVTDEPNPLLRTMFWAAATALVCGGGIYLLFAQIFLVRLP
jgi:hypothetical protein